MNNGDITYRIGKIYISEEEYSITNDNGNKNHRWIDYSNLRHYFKFLPKNKGLTARGLILIQSEIEPAYPLV